MGFENFEDVPIATLPGERQGTNAVPVRDVEVRAGRDERAYGFGVSQATIAEYDRFNQGGPVEIVDMVEGAPLLIRVLTTSP